MKRDIELYRKILAAVEACQDPPIGWIEPFEIEGYDDLAVSYHIELMDEAGLIDGKDLTTGDLYIWKPIRLTWDGHDFLEAAQNDTIWRKVMDKVKQFGGGVAVDVIAGLLKEEAKRQFDIS